MLIQAFLTRQANNILSSNQQVSFIGKCRIKIISISALVSNPLNTFILTSPQIINNKSSIFLLPKGASQNDYFNNMYIIDDVMLNGSLEFYYGPYLNNNNLFPGTQAGSVWAVLTLDIEYM
jgi:hypothetical protein